MSLAQEAATTLTQRVWESLALVPLLQLVPRLRAPLSVLAPPPQLAALLQLVPVLQLVPILQQWDPLQLVRRLRATSLAILKNGLGVQHPYMWRGPKFLCKDPKHIGGRDSLNLAKWMHGLFAVFWRAQ